MDGKVVSVNTNQINMELGQSNVQMDNTSFSGLSGGTGFSGGSNSSMSNFPSGTNTLDDSNPSLRFWSSGANNNYVTMPSFMSDNNSNAGAGYSSSTKSNGNGAGGVNLQQQQPVLSVDPLQRNNSEPAVSLSNDKYSYGNMGKNSSMTVNSPTYAPSYGSGRYSGSKNASQRLDSDVLFLGNSGLDNKMNYEYTYSSNNSAMNPELYERSSLTNFAISGRGEKDADNLSEEIKRYKVELIVKNQMIKNLSDQLNSSNRLKDKRLSEMGWNMTPTKGLKVPRNHYQLFKDLTKTLQERTQELDETKERLEALLVSLTMSEASNTKFTNNGNFDEQELTHKIVSKLSLLQNENENLLKMISFGNKSSLVIELGLLKNENKILKEKLANLEDHECK